MKKRGVFVKLEIGGELISSLTKRLFMKKDEKVHGAIYHYLFVQFIINHDTWLSSFLQ